MTVYTASIMLKHHHRGDLCRRLWADTSDEALMAAYGCGATIDDLQPGTSFENYLITEAQQDAAIAAGAVQTDWMEPRYQRAKREGDDRMVLSIELSRASGAVRPAQGKHWQPGEVVQA